MCSGEFFLFRGGCYSQQGTPGSEICTAAEGGRCTACKTDGSYIFQNKAATVTLGNECILCSDAKGADGAMGVANCNKCTHTGTAGATTCSACQEGYFLSGQTCTKCADTCATCTAANTCTSCGGSKYLLGTSCVDSSGCGNGKYADPQSNKCLECGITDCATCAYDAALQGPKCLTCTSSSSKKVKTALDGTTTCVDVTPQDDCTDANHFKADDNSACYLCSDTSGDNPTTNKGIAQCKACTKQKGAAPECSACLDGYFYDGRSCTATCGTGCATCSVAGNANKCLTCMAGFFLVTTGENKKCVACDSTPDGGREGCSACSNDSTFKCTKCKPNRKSVGTEGTQVTCEEKICEEDSACGGTAGSCGAIVVGGDGSMKYHCSQCRQQ